VKGSNLRPSGGKQMSGYRVYIVGQNGGFVGVREMNAETDADAIAEAKKFLDGSDLEIWRGQERIAYLPSDDSSHHGASPSPSNGHPHAGPDLDADP
jgi:hypothetical protein